MNNPQGLQTQLSTKSIFSIFRNPLLFLLVSSSLLGGILVFAENLRAEDSVEKNFDELALVCRSWQDPEKRPGAIAACNQAITQNPNDPLVWIDRADALFAEKQYMEALLSYRRVLGMEPRNSPVMAKECATLSELKEYTEAIAVCEKALNIDENWQDTSPAIAWYHRGVAFRQLGNIEQALYSNDWALQLEPNFSLAWAERCTVLSNVGSYSDAIKACEQALKTDQENDANTLATIWGTQGSLFKQLKYYDEALKSYNQALVLNPKNAENWTEYGNILGILGRHGEASTAYQWAQKITPQSSLVLTNQCANLNRLGQYEPALAACDMALQEGDGNWGEYGPAMAWSQRGNALTGLGRYEEALTSANRALAINPNYPDAWSNRSATLWHLGRFPEAIASTERAIALKSDSSLAWFNQARILTTLGQYDAAISAYELAIQGDANIGDRPSLAEIWVNQSAVFLRLSRYGEAVSATQQAIALYADFPQAFYNQGLGLMGQGLYEDAVKAYEEAIELDPQNADFWAGKGLAFQYLEEYPDAIAAFQKALELNPNHAQAKQNLEFVQYQLKKQAEKKTATAE
jgi:tetratricopeptide (TPR) repeat protein